MPSTPERRSRLRTIVAFSETPGFLRWTSVAIVLSHFLLLVLGIPRFRFSGDTPYHLAMARQYAEHVSCFQDRVHYAPSHRPNLQGPALHFTMGLVARGLGGGGDTLIRLNVVFGLLNWLAAAGTVMFFARRYGDDRAMLVATAVFTGGAYGSGTFAANLPCSWMYVATPWAIHFFVQRRLVLSSLFAALACYSHLGGFATAPIGVLLAAVLLGRWRALVITGLGVALLTLPYTVHLLRSLDYYHGTKGGTAWWYDPFGTGLLVLGLASALRRPRENAFLVAWALAPIAWIVQDASRFLVLATFAGSVLGGIAISRFVRERCGSVTRLGITAAVFVVATYFPLGVPALFDRYQAIRTGFPNSLDWDEFRTCSRACRRLGRDKLVQGYAPHVSSAMAVWSPVRTYKGHWIEVRPPVDPAEDYGVARMVYVLPIPADDAFLADAEARGWLRVLDGGEWLSAVEFLQRPNEENARRFRNATWPREAGWIAENVELNALGDPFQLFFSDEYLARRRHEKRDSQRHVALMQVALLLHAHALEPTNAARAREFRQRAVGFGGVASLVGDEASFGFRTPEAHSRFRSGMRRAAGMSSDAERERLIFATFDEYLVNDRGSLF